MTSQRITKRTIDTIHPAGSEFTIWDSDLTGFGVRVRPNGAKSYIVVYRAGHGRKAPVRKLTLGAVGKITPDEARNLARKAIGSVAHGLDPAIVKADARQSITLSELAELFLAGHVRPKRKGTTAARYEHALKAHVVPELGTMKAEKVTRAAVAKLHLKLEHIPAMANYVLAVVGSMYGFAQKRGLVPEGCNPANRIEKYPEHGRERFLTGEELARLGDVIREAETTGLLWEIDESKPTAKHAVKAEKRRTRISPHAAAAIRLLLFTGARLREILHLRWEHVDLERGLLFLPDSKTGKKTIVLSAPALAVLTALPRAGSFVIAGDDPERPRADLKRPWSIISRQAQLDGVRIHDLRHSFASFGAGASLGLPVIGKLLGHTQSATTNRYAHLDADPLRRAADLIGERIASAMGETTAKKAGEIVPLKRGSMA